MILIFLLFPGIKKTFAPDVIPVGKLIFSRNMMPFISECFYCIFSSFKCKYPFFYIAGRKSILK
jgi:biotin synthase-like enzyme